MRNSPTSELYRMRYNAAMFAGLNEEWCHKVGRGETTLAEALGDMDMDDESLPGDVEGQGNVGYGCCRHRLDDDCNCIPF